MMNVNKYFDLLPYKYQSIINNFDIIDRIYCILTKRKLPCILAKLRLIYQDIFTHVATLDSFTLLCNDLMIICTLCSNHYIIRNYNSLIESSTRGGIYYDKCLQIELEFVCVSYAGVSKSHIKERRKILIESFFDFVLNHYTSTLHNNLINKDATIKNVLKKGFSVDYSVESILLPEIDVELKLSVEKYLDSINSEHIKNTITNPLMNNNEKNFNYNTSDKEIIPISIDKLHGANGILEYLKGLPNYNNQIKHVERFPSKDAIYEQLETPLEHKLLIQQISSRINLTKGLYRHQVKGMNALRKGKHVVVSTATASGKSLIYNIPIVEHILNNPQATALYLFPTKALAQDQLRSLSSFICDQSTGEVILPIGIGTCDGDTSQAERIAIQGKYNNANNDNHGNHKINIILTNPDMLHCTLLPDHNNWCEIFKNLKYVVIDEAHMYSGIFGSHVSAIIRRLIRICIYYQQSHPQFICCSATIANPLEHMRKLIPIDMIIDSFGINMVDISEHVVVVDSNDDGAPQRERLFAIWNPSIKFNGNEIIEDDQVSVHKNHPEKVIDPCNIGRTNDIDTAVLITQNNNSNNIETIIEATTDDCCLTTAIGIMGDMNPLRNTSELIIEDNTSIQKIMTSFASSCVASCVAIPTKASSSEENHQMLSPKKRNFLKACEETRPSTIGPVGPSNYPHTSSGYIGLSSGIIPESDSEKHVWEVEYVGGWKRGRKKVIREPSLLSNIHYSVEGKNSIAQTTNCDIVADHMNAVSVPNVEIISRTSSICDTAHLFTAIIKKRVRCIAFCKVRKLVELVLNYTINNLEYSKNCDTNINNNDDHDEDENVYTDKMLIPYIASYRGGYTKEERRVIEHNLFEGKLLGVTATCALELGIDIGTLDITLHMGFPGSFSSLWQQAGRAGRSMDRQSCLSILICFDCPVDQYFARNPQILFHSSNEFISLDINNNQVLLSHLLCAAKEIPLNFPFIYNHGSNIPSSNSNNNTKKSLDLCIWGSKYYEILQYLVESYKLHPCSNNNNYPAHEGQQVRNPSKAAITLSKTMWKIASGSLDLIKMISIRMVDPISINILDDSRGGVVIDSLGYSRAFYELYEGAIYMHRAIQYLVTKLDLIAHVAHTIPVKVKYYTSASNKTTVNIIKELQSDGIMHVGNVQVIAQVYGYVKKWLGSGEIFDKGECSLPPLEYESTSFWIDLPIDIKHALENVNICPISCLHTANHILKSLSVCHAQQCDLADLGTEHMLSKSALEHPFRILIYDKRCGGMDASFSIFEHRNKLIEQAYDVLSHCPCTTGCPSCILDHRCSLYNQNLNKSGTLLLLKLLLAHQTSNVASIPLSSSKISTTVLGSNLDISNPKNDLINDSINLNFEYSPRKAARKKSMKKVSYRDSAKAHKLAIQMNWTDSNPSFIQD